MKKTGKIISIILVVAMLITANVTNVFAANVCKNVWGTGKITRTFTIKTDKNWLTSNKVKLTQTAMGTAKGKKWSSGKQKTYKIWGHYTVYVMNSKGKVLKRSSWTGKNFTVSGLKKNTKYIVKVVPYSNGGISATWSGVVNGGFYGWKYVPCWNVKWTKGITLCA